MTDLSFDVELPEFDVVIDPVETSVTVPETTVAVIAVEGDVDAVAGLAQAVGHGLRDRHRVFGQEHVHRRLRVLHRSIVIGKPGGHPPPG